MPTYKTKETKTKNATKEHNDIRLALGQNKIISAFPYFLQGGEIFLQVFFINKPLIWYSIQAF